MAELSLMASAAFSPSILHQDQALLRPPTKDLQALSPGHGKRQLNTGPMQIGMPRFEDPWKFSSLLPENQRDWTAAKTNNSVLIDVQDLPDSVLFSFGVAEQCTRHEKILKFLTSGSNLTDGHDIDISLISKLMGFHRVTIDVCPQPQTPMEDEFCLYENEMGHPQQILHPKKQIYAPKALLDFVVNLTHTSSLTVHPNGHVLFTGSEDEMKDLLSIVAELNQSESLSAGSKKAMVVPYFTRKRGGHARSNAQFSLSNFKAHTVVPSKSSTSGNIKTKTPSKKKPKSTTERLGKNYIYACDCLFNIYADKRGERTTILSLKNSSPELTQLLSQFSAGIVGTGLAVLLSVACKVMNARVLPLSSAKLFNISFGLGLFWLSWAVNSLRDTVYNFGKRSVRAKKPQEEAAVVENVKKSMNEVLFRFAALLAVGILSF